MRALALLLPLLCGAGEPEAGWLDPDIVLDGEKWRHIGNANKAGEPPAPKTDSWTKSDTRITVLIAAWRKSRLTKTLHALLSKADHPSRVFFGVVQQHAEGDEDCMVGLCRELGTPITLLPGSTVKEPKFAGTAACKYFDQVRVVRMTTAEAKGPVFARSRQPETLRDGDDFCMQIDAHTDGVQGWDTKMLAEWGHTENEYAVITSYPTNVHDMGKNTNKHWEMPHLCGGAIVGPGLISNSQASAAAGLTRPLLTPLWAAGLSFMKCHAERNVPNDPELKGIFSGEAYGRGARLWTHGYDFYSAMRPHIGVWSMNKMQEAGSHMGASSGTTPAEAAAATLRLTTLLQWPGTDHSPAALAKLGKWGLGKRRSLEQYAAFSGIDTIQATTQTGVCRVQYVPWASGAKHTVYSEYKAGSKVLAREALRGADSVAGPSAMAVQGACAGFVLLLFTARCCRRRVLACDAARARQRRSGTSHR